MFWTPLRACPQWWPGTCELRLVWPCRGPHTLFIVQLRSLEDHTPLLCMQVLHSPRVAWGWTQVCNGNFGMDLEWTNLLWTKCSWNIPRLVPIPLYVLYTSSSCSPQMVPLICEATSGYKATYGTMVALHGYHVPIPLHGKGLDRAVTVATKYSVVHRQRVSLHGYIGYIYTRKTSTPIPLSINYAVVLKCVVLKCGWWINTSCCHLYHNYAIISTGQFMLRMYMQINLEFHYSHKEINVPVLSPIITVTILVFLLLITRLDIYSGSVPTYILRNWWTTTIVLPVPHAWGK